MYWFIVPGLVDGITDVYSNDFTVVAPAGCLAITDMEVSIAWDTGSSAFSNNEFYVELRRDGTLPVVLVNDIHGTLTGNTTPTYTSTNAFDVISTFDDKALNSSTGETQPTNENFRPFEPLSLYDGTDPNAVWTLNIAEFDVGNPPPPSDFLNIDSVAFTFSCEVPCVPPTRPGANPRVASSCGGDTVLVNFSGSLNTATHWAVYTGSCGGGSRSAFTTSNVYFSPYAPTSTYYIRGEDGAGCVDESLVECDTVVVVQTAYDDPSFSYASASYCQNASDPTPTVTGLAGGTFSSTTGLVLNASDGSIDLDASTVGTYFVTYTTAGVCPSFASVSVTINAADDTSFGYADRFYCGDESNAIPVVTGVGTGTFSSSPAGMVLNPSTGEIDVGLTSFGDYAVTYATTGSSCPSSTVDSVRISSRESPFFTYSGSTWCTNHSPRTPTTSTPGGTFSVAEAGLSIDSNTGTINFLASASGTYSIKYRTSADCPDSLVNIYTIQTTSDPSFSYSQAAYCETADDPTPTITGVTGGVFSAASGLTINSTTGAVDISASTPAAYQVRYIAPGVCPDTLEVAFAVLVTDDPSFNFPDPSYCTNVTDPTPMITGLAGGTFSAGAGLAINGSSGVVDLSASTANTYQVRYITAGACPDTSDVALTVQAADNSSFSYGTSSYCRNGVDPVPIITGLPGGVFFASAGISVHSSLGTVDLSASTAGSRTISYRTTGACPDTTDVNLTLITADDASFNFSAGSYCANGTDPTPTITGVTGGTFSSSLGLIINSSTGEVDLSASSSGTYSVRYSTAGACANSSIENLTVNAADNSTFNYASSSFCVNGTDPSPSFVALSGGTYNSASGLSVNSSSGLIDLSSSTAGAHTMTYTTAGACPGSTTINLMINASDNASFSYGASAFCANVTDPTPTITGVTGGTFSAGSGLALNSSTGVVDLSASTAGSYTVNYLTGGLCPNTGTFSLTVNASDNASFGYGSPSYCANTSDPSPTVTGTTGGTFSSLAGLSLNSSTGQVDLSLSTLGAYSVTYITPGSCPDTSSVSLTVASLDNASFSFSQSSYCVNGSDPLPSSVFMTGGTFSSASGLTVNASTGEIDLSSGTPGPQTITYQTVGPCPNSSTVSFSLSPADNASFSYEAAAFCANVT
ncbi:MAG: hypothetical protein MI784_00405, partial [Cytophagales bacterium]|nr:hypothetical protein [Cytophagales bacterium]